MPHAKNSKGVAKASEQSFFTLQVNYVGKSINLYKDAGYKLSGSSFVINKLLGTTWLWDRVRVSGGAYGGFSDFDHHTGLLTFLSYRDPNLLKTVRPSIAQDCEMRPEGFAGGSSGYELSKYKMAYCLPTVVLDDLRF